MLKINQGNPDNQGKEGHGEAHTFSGGPSLVLPFLGSSVLTKENLQICQGFSFPAERKKTLEKQEKRPISARTFLAENQESPQQTKPERPKRKVHEFRSFCEFWCFSSGKQARFTLNFCSAMPLRKVHELTFLWFGLPGPLLKKSTKEIQTIKGRKDREMGGLGGGPKVYVEKFTCFPDLPFLAFWGIPCFSSFARNPLVF